MMSLRLTEGMSLSRYTRMLGRAPDAARLSMLAQDGFIALDDDRIRATETGRLLLNRLILELSGA